jgi:hypothetical protein
MAPPTESVRATPALSGAPAQFLYGYNVFDIDPDCHHLLELLREM